MGAEMRFTLHQGCIQDIWREEWRTVWNPFKNAPLAVKMPVCAKHKHIVQSLRICSTLLHVQQSVCLMADLSFVAT